MPVKNQIVPSQTQISTANKNNADLDCRYSIRKLLGFPKESSLTLSMNLALAIISPTFFQRRKIFCYGLPDNHAVFHPKHARQSHVFAHSIYNVYPHQFLFHRFLSDLQISSFVLICKGSPVCRFHSVACLIKILSPSSTNHLNKTTHALNLSVKT